MLRLSNKGCIIDVTRMPGKLFEAKILQPWQTAAKF